MGKEAYMFNFSAGRVVFGAMIVLMGLWTTPAPAAQESPKQEPSPGQTNITDKELSTFAKAYVEYHKIRQEYETQLTKVQDPKEKEKIQQEGNSKVKKALEKQGLTSESYNRIFAAVNGNEQVRKKVLKMIEAERKGS